jgi:hypothetical protein
MEEQEGWGKLLLTIYEHLGLGWFLIVSGLFLFLYRIGAVKALVTGRWEERRVEREHLSEETQRLIDNLRLEADRQREDRAEDCRRYEDTIIALREDVSRLIRSIEKSEAGNARLRHSLNSVLQHIVIHNRQLRANGQEVDPFPVDTLLSELDDSFGQYLRDVMRDA